MHRPNFGTLNSIKDQLERETHDLMNQRNSIEVHRPSASQVPYSYEQFDSNYQSPKVWQEQGKARKSNFQVQKQKKQDIKNKIKQIIELCKQENAATDNDIHGVVREEKQILNLLEQIDFDHFGRKKPIGKQAISQLTPIKSPFVDEYRSKPQSISRPLPNTNLSEEALQVIQQIQRRAFEEIQKLKYQLNEQRNKNIELSRELQYYKKNQNAPGQTHGAHQHQLRSRISYLENLLNQEQQKNQSLRWQIQSENIPDISVLYAQAEAIRQDTLRLLKLKEAKNSDEKTRTLIAEIDHLKSRNDTLQKQNSELRQGKHSEALQHEYSPIPTNHKRTNSYRNSANEYESLVMQMRKITGLN